MKTSHVITLNPHNNGNMGGAFPGGPNEWFLFISRPVGGREDTIFERHVSGRYVDECRVYGTGHVTGSGALGLKDEIWTRMGNDVVRFTYRPGRVNRADVKRVECFVPNGQDAQVSFSPTRTYAYIRYRGQGTSVITRRRVTDLIRGVNRKAGKTITVSHRGLGAAQSFGGVGKNVFLVFGWSTDHKGAKSYVEQWSLATGEKVGRHEITRLGNDVVPGKYEAEFAPGRYLLSKVGSGAARRLVIYAHDLAPVISLPSIGSDPSPSPEPAVIPSDQESNPDTQT